MNCISIPLNYILHKYLGFKNVCLLVLQLLPPHPLHPPPLGEAGGIGVTGPGGGRLEEGGKGEKEGEEGEVVHVPQT